MKFLVLFLFSIQALAAGNAPVIWGPNASAQLLTPHLRITGTAPTVTANCGTSPVVSGNDSIGSLNVGTGGTATTCTLTFNVTWTNAPVCVVVGVGAAFSGYVSTTTSTLVITGSSAFAASQVVAWECEGY